MADSIDSLETSLGESDVRLTRHPFVYDGGGDDATVTAFHEMEIEIPLRGEEIIVHKRPVVREEVVVTKFVTERIVPVTQRVRRETLGFDDSSAERGVR